MKLQILGCGYIGSVNAYSLMGRAQVSMYDTNPKKQEAFEARTPLFDETNFDWRAFYDRVTFGKLDAPDAIIVCVNAEVEGDGYDLTGILGILRDTPDTPVILRSTIGAREIASLEGQGHGCLYYWPEFLREGSAISDFHRDENFVAHISGRDASDLVRAVVGDYTPVSDPKAAASVKFLSNYYRALKVSFGNQIGVILDSNGIDQDVFFDIFFRLRGNCDAMYLRPGPPYGGLCLPKETAMADRLIDRFFGAEANLAAATTRVNEAMIRRKVDAIRATGTRNIGISQFSFKKGTSDLRNSPTLALAETLAPNMAVFDLDGSSGGRFPAPSDSQAVDSTFRGHEDW